MFVWGGCTCAPVTVSTMCQLPLRTLPSAGVGRTGTLIGLDVELQRATREGVVDPYNFVLHMRDQRNLMVQTEVSIGGHWWRLVVVSSGGGQWWLMVVGADA